jgi:hypothetical protein
MGQVVRIQKLVAYFYMRRDVRLINAKGRIFSQVKFIKVFISLANVAFLIPFM